MRGIVSCFHVYPSPGCAGRLTERMKLFFPLQDSQFAEMIVGGTEPEEKIIQAQL